MIPCQASTTVVCLHYRPKTGHCSTKNAYTSEITFLALVPWFQMDFLDNISLGTQSCLEIEHFPTSFPIKIWGKSVKWLHELSPDINTTILTPTQ